MNIREVILKKEYARFSAIKHADTQPVYDNMVSFHMSMRRRNDIATIKLLNVLYKCTLQTY